MGQAALKIPAAKLNAFRVQLLTSDLIDQLPVAKRSKFPVMIAAVSGSGTIVSLTISAINISIADGAQLGKFLRALFRHSLDRFLAQVKAVLSRQPDLDLVNELLARFGVGAEDFASPSEL